MILRFSIIFGLTVLFVCCVKARIVVKCAEPSRTVNCTILNVQANKNGEIYDFSSFREQYYDYTYGYQMASSVIKYVTFQESTLYQLPVELFTQISQLHYVSAQNCSINKINKSEFENANNLQKLILSHNNIQIIEHMVFWGASKLLELNLASNHINNIRETAFYNLGQLVELNLANNQIQEIKNDYFRDLKSLKFISLSQNNITSIASDLFDNNVMLEIIRLNDNRIASVGDEFLMAHNSLNFLYLQNNSIETLNFETMKAKSINLNENNLTAVQIGSNCIRLFAADNQISNVTVKNGVSITHLYLVRNQINDLSTISTLSSIQHLDISSNNIGPLNLTTFAALKKLLSLSLSYTNISNLEYGTFSHQPLLTKLDISYNLLKNVNLNIFTSLTSLEKLFLDGNDLTEIAFEDIKHTLPNLKTISLSDNNWNCTYLTMLMKKMNAVQVEIKIDPVKFVLNTTNQKGIACSDSKTDVQKKWFPPTFNGDFIEGSLNSSKYVEEMSKTIDKLIASINTTNVDDLRGDIAQLKERLRYFEKKLTDHEMELIKTQLQIATKNITTQPKTPDGSWIRNLVDQLNNLTLQRQQLNNDVISQKVYEVGYKAEQNAKNVARLETIMEAKNKADENSQRYHSLNTGIQTEALKTSERQSPLLTVMLAITLTVVVMYCGFKAMTLYTNRRRRHSAFSNRNSNVTLEQAI